MSDRTLLNRPAVAARLGLTLYGFDKRRPALDRDGFPAPIFGAGAGARWDPVALDRWLDAKLPWTRDQRATAGQHAEAIADAAAIAIMLDRNAARLAGEPEGSA